MLETLILRNHYKKHFTIYKTKNKKNWESKNLVLEGGWKKKVKGIRRVGRWMEKERWGDKKGWKVDGKGKVKGIRRGGRWMEKER